MLGCSLGRSFGSLLMQFSRVIYIVESSVTSWFEYQYGIPQRRNYSLAQINQTNNVIKPVHEIKKRLQLATKAGGENFGLMTIGITGYKISSIGPAEVLFPKRERVFHRGIQTPRNK